MSWGVRDLAVGHGDRRALHGVSLQARPGEVVAVVGGDGAGKTTLLRVLAGTLAAERGAVQRPPASCVGGQLGTAGVWDDLTVAENLAFTAACYRVPRPMASTRAAELTAAAGLTAARDRPAGALSGGMRQKLGVCAALLHRPELVLLDEPTTGVDPLSRAEIWRLLARGAAAGAAVVVATTHLDEAERAHRVLVLADGRELVAGPPAALVDAAPGAATLADVVVAAQLAQEQAA